MGYVLIGIVTALNMLIILAKFKRKRYEDGVFDTGFMILMVMIFSGSFGGMVVAMVASLCISIALFISPPTFTKNAAVRLKDFVDECEGRKPPRKRNNRYDL